MKLISQNKKAKFNYFLELTLEAGIVLKGSEIKSIRSNGINIDNAYVAVQDGELLLYQSNIKEYFHANRFNHNPNRIRKLLIKKKEIRNLIGKTKIKGYSIVPVSAYFNEKNLVKIEIALGKGKKLFDKRNIIKQRDWKKQQERMFKNQTRN